MQIDMQNNMQINMSNMQNMQNNIMKNNMQNLNNEKSMHDMQICKKKNIYANYARYHDGNRNP